jgi:hypothetical protein
VRRRILFALIHCPFVHYIRRDVTITSVRSLVLVLVLDLINQLRPGRATLDGPMSDGPAEVCRWRWLGAGRGMSDRRAHDQFSFVWSHLERSSACRNLEERSPDWAPTISCGTAGPAAPNSHEYAQLATRCSLCRRTPDACWAHCLLLGTPAKA